MKRGKINFIVDVALLILMCIIAGIGFLIEFVLPPGDVRKEIYGKNVELTFLGLNRHSWGDIHLYLGIILLILIAIHIYLHVPALRGMFRGYIKNPLTRKAGAIMLVISNVLSLSFWTFVSPTVANTEEDPYVKGYMTLKEVSEINDVPIEYLLVELNLSKATVNLKIKDIKKIYNITTEDVKNAIEKYIGKKDISKSSDSAQT